MGIEYFQGYAIKRRVSIPHVTRTAINAVHAVPDKKISKKKITDLEAAINGACRALPQTGWRGTTKKEEMPWECCATAVHKNENFCALPSIPCGLRRTYKGTKGNIALFNERKSRDHRTINVLQGTHQPEPQAAAHDAHALLLPRVALLQKTRQNGGWPVQHLSRSVF